MMIESFRSFSNGIHLPTYQPLTRSMMRRPTLAIRSQLYCGRFASNSFVRFISSILPPLHSDRLKREAFHPGVVL